MTADTPANHDLPPVYRGELTSVDVETLFADLAACAEVQHVQVRLNRDPSRDPQGADDGVQRLPGKTASSQPRLGLALAEAKQLLANGCAHMIQIRYQHECKSWCDTLLAQPSGVVRLIRMVDQFHSKEKKVTS